MRHCVICGLTEDTFQKFGKFGCSACIPIFSPNPPKREKRTLDLGMWENYKEVWKKSSPQIISYRVRLTRNLSNRLFPHFHTEQTAVDKLRAQWTSLSKESPSASGNTYGGSEDHFRWERILPWGQKATPLSISQLRFLLSPSLFAYEKSRGFLTSCPTNLGKGRRDSLFLTFEKRQFSTVLPIFRSLEEIGIEFAPSSDEYNTGNFSGSKLLVKLWTKNGLAAQKRDFRKILGLLGLG